MNFPRFQQYLCTWESTPAKWVKRYKNFSKGFASSQTNTLRNPKDTEWQRYKKNNISWLNRTVRYTLPSWNLNKQGTVYLLICTGETQGLYTSKEVSLEIYTSFFCVLLNLLQSIQIFPISEDYLFFVKLLTYKLYKLMDFTVVFPCMYILCIDHVHPPFYSSHSLLVVPLLFLVFCVFFLTAFRISLTIAEIHGCLPKGISWLL